MTDKQALKRAAEILRYKGADYPFGEAYDIAAHLEALSAPADSTVLKKRLDEQVLATEFRKEVEKWPGMTESEGIKAWFWFRQGHGALAAPPAAEPVWTEEMIAQIDKDAAMLLSKMRPLPTAADEQVERRHRDLLLHRLRNPYGRTDNEARADRQNAADLIESLYAEVQRLRGPCLSDHPGCVYCMEKGTPVKPGCVCPKCGDRLPTEGEYHAWAEIRTLTAARDRAVEALHETQHDLSLGLWAAARRKVDSALAASLQPKDMPA